MAKETFKIPQVRVHEELGMPEERKSSLGQPVKPGAYIWCIDLPTKGRWRSKEVFPGCKEGCRVKYCEVEE